MIQYDNAQICEVVTHIVGNIAMTFYRAGNGFLTPVVAHTWLIGVAGIVALFA